MDKHLTFEVLNEDEVIAIVSLHKPTGEVDVKNISHDFFDKNICRDIVDVESLNDWFEFRCFLPTRADKDILLREIGLKEYVPYHIVKITHGALFEDTHWIRFEGEVLKWADVNPRRHNTV